MLPEHLDHLLEQNQPKLSAAEEAELWQRIAPQVGVPTPVPSPYVFASFFKTRAMIPLLIALMVMVGAGGTVAVSEAAKPGDVLFPIERVVERTRLALASDERASQLRSTFAAERLAELEAILSEEGVFFSYDDQIDTASSTDAVLTLAAEADVFNDVTVVKVEINGKTYSFTTTATTRDEVVVEISQRYDISQELVANVLDFEIEERESRAGERGKYLVDDRGEERISIAAKELLNQLEEVNDSSVRDSLLMALLAQIDTVTVRGREDRGRGNDAWIDVRAEDKRIRIDDDRIEIREEGYRIRADRDGEVRVKTDDDAENDDEVEKDSWDDSDLRVDESGDDSQDDFGTPEDDSDEVDDREREDSDDYGEGDSEESRDREIDEAEEMEETEESEKPEEEDDDSKDDESKEDSDDIEREEEEDEEEKDLD
jgi:hypothetical protein